MPIQATMKLEGLDNLEEKLEKLEGVLVKAGTDSAYRQAEDLRDLIRSKIPVGRTGNLQRSPVARRFERYAGAGIDRKIAPHAHLVEFGTSHSSAHPFLRPAVDEFKGKVADRFSRDVKDGINKAV